MAAVWCFTQFLLLCFAALFPASESELVQIPEGRRLATVFLLIEGDDYTLNFTAAKDACQSVQATMATKEQMQRALQQGLETCKYGWIAEGVAVVPRLTPDVKCGKNKTGLVEWAAKPDKLFGAFCFSDSEETLQTSTSAPPTTSDAPMTKAPTQAGLVSVVPANCYGQFLNSFTSYFILLTSVLSLLQAYFL